MTVTLYLIGTVFCGTVKVTDALCFLIFIWQEKKNGGSSQIHFNRTVTGIGVMKLTVLISQSSEKCSFAW